MKARGTTLDFQADGLKRVQDLSKMTTVDIDTIVVFARDFRRICPLQRPGAKGGYSEAELEEIQVLIEAQCAEINTIQAQWTQEIQQLHDLQAQSQLCQDEFNTKYAKCTQEVAMAEGLGQKYGAPRRRAQERIRTEVSRDERAAGKVDELLALIEFICSEMSASDQMLAATNASPIEDGKGAQQSPSKHTTDPSESTIKGIESINRMQYLWHLMLALRTSLIDRVKFLDVLTERSFVEITNTTLLWLDEERLYAAVHGIFSSQAHLLQPSPSIPCLEDNVIPGQAPSMATLQVVFDDICAVCRKETKQLYESEGKAATIPAPLEQWLSETKEKLLGKQGYHERAWKKLWAQAHRLDQLLSRLKPNEEEGGHVHLDATGTVCLPTLPFPPSTLYAVPKLSIQGVCLLSLAQAHVALSRRSWKQQALQFAELLQIWEQGRDKHERLLKPRLGSPDKVEALNALDREEMERSKDMIRSVLTFRGTLVRSQAERFRHFCEDLGIMSRSFLLMLDSILRQELVVLPPDTTVPKKHMTLKKLRKAQRIREDVAKGKEDISQKRLWAGIMLAEDVVAIITSAEDMVPDLGSDTSDLTGSTAPEDGNGSRLQTDNSGKDKKDDKKLAKKERDKNAPPATAIKPSLIPTPWLERLLERSSVQGLVNSAHRTVIQYRDEGLNQYLAYMSKFLKDVREDYQQILQQEESWTQRWQRQVAMLRQGKI